MKVIVLGAGVVGTTSAWYLRQAGHEVTVIDRQPAAGMETSFANGGQISVGQAEPWANPEAIHKILRWLGREDAPLLFRLRADPRQWQWGLQFLLQCRASRARTNIRQLVTLGMHSRRCLQALRRELGLQYDHLEKGILTFFTDPHELEGGVKAAEWMRSLGNDRRVVSVDEALRIEPALAPIRQQLQGAIYTAADESGDAHRFTQALAARNAANGVEYCLDTQILKLVKNGDRLGGVEIEAAGGRRRTLQADSYVLALGSYSPLLLRPLGIRIPVYPAKGYSITIDIAKPEVAPSVSLTDEGRKLVISRLGQRLRMAGTAELNGYDTTLNPVRLQALIDRAYELFPDIGPRHSIQTWTGLRPATPDNIPLIGKTRLRNLFLNTGHGPLGWTHSCGSAQLLADIVGGKAPEVDFAWLGRGG